MSAASETSVSSPGPRQNGASETTKRVLTALVLAPLLLAATWLGGWVFGLVLLAAALVAQHEVYGLLKKGGHTPAVVPGMALGAILFGSVVVPAWLPVAIALFVLLVVASPFVVPEKGGIVNLAETAFGALYPTALLAYLVALREHLVGGGTAAFWLTLTVFFLVWATDIGAYYVGRAFGKHALAPSISPKKTWEGAIGGAAAAVLVAVGLRMLVLGFLPWGHLIVVALLCGVASQLGDLAESRMKRAVGAKDSGTILPGHGGVLDRLDATIVAAPLVYLYLVYGAGLG